MAVNREAFKPTNLKVLAEQEKETASIVGSRNNRAGFLTIDKGENKFRIYPAHPRTQSFIYSCVKHWLPTVNDDGRESKKPVFNSRVHGKTPKDIVEEYIRYTTEKLKDEGVDNSVMEPIIGGKMDRGIMATDSWICYADKYSGSSKTFGRLELSKGTKNKLEEVASETEDADSPMVVDPFTDVDEGICVIIDYDPDRKDNSGKKDIKNIYRLSLEQRRKKMNIELIPTPLSEDDIEKFSTQETLESLYVKSYKRSDFNLALKGLRYFDKKYNFNTFQDDNFLDIVEEIDAYYPNDSEAEEVKETMKPKTTNITQSVETKKSTLIEKTLEENEEDESEEEILKDIKDKTETPNEPPFKPTGNIQDRISALRNRYKNG